MFHIWRRQQFKCEAERNSVLAAETEKWQTQKSYLSAVMRQWHPGVSRASRETGEAQALQQQRDLEKLCQDYVGSVGAGSKGHLVLGQ